MRVAVIGASGQLGYDITRSLEERGHELLCLGRADLRVEDIDSVAAALKSGQPDFVVNTAAFHEVPLCEKEPSLAYSVNALGAHNVACVAAEVGAPVAYVSTDYVFDGLKEEPYIESDQAAPVNIYGASKLAGEQLVRVVTSRHVILRVTGLYGVKGSKKGHNFPDMMLKRAVEQTEVRVVTDQVCTPTYTVDIALQLESLIRSGAFGTFHSTNEGWCSWYELTRHLYSLVGVTTPLVPVTSAAFPSPVRRPQYSVLENYNLRGLGLDLMPCWQNAIERYLKEKRIL